jgi:chromosome segregation ATPase
MPEQWALILAALFGAGGLGAVIVNAFAGRKRTSAEVEKIKADAVAVLTEAYEKRLSSLTQRSVQLEEKVDCLEKRVDELKMQLSDRDNIILVLQKENTNLQTQLDKMLDAVKARDKRIRELERQVAELIQRINILNGSESVDGKEQ